MEFTVQRRWGTDKSTIGEMTIDSRPFHAFTLEPPFRSGNVKPRAIAAGRYRLTWRWSQEHGCNLPHVENVPGFDAIEIHAGNSAKDTKGCTCVATSYDPNVPDWISHSDAKRDELYRIVEETAGHNEDMWITYIDPPQPTQ